MASVEGFEITRGSVVTFITTEADGPFHCENIAPLYEVVTSELVNWEIGGAFEDPKPPAPAGTRIAVTVMVLGEFNLDGDEVEASSARAQLLTNLKFLVTDVVAPVDDGDGTASLELFGVTGGSEGEAKVQFVGGLRPTPISPHACAVTFDMYFPQGVPITGSGS